MTKGIRSLAAIVSLAGTLAILGLAPSAYAAEGANFAATGHDMDFHCNAGQTSECEYFKIVVDKVRKGSTLPILALDQGAELPGALAKAGYTKLGEVVTVNPAETLVFNATPFVGVKGEPLYSAIITASDETCGGCDNNEAGETNINARAADFETYFNAGGGIFALAGAGRFTTYYNFMPLKVGATAVSPPFEVTAEGVKLGITNTMANCCATHNSFTFPPPEPLVTLEKDTAGKAETIAAFNVKVTKIGFSSVTTKLSGEGKSAEEITVKEGTAVTDSATLTGEHAAEATGKVEYKVYSDKECKTLVAEAGTVTVTGGVIPDSSPETLAKGTYDWQASYSGDANNKPAKSTCGSEVEIVEGAPKSATCGKTTIGKVSDALLSNQKRVNRCVLPVNASVSKLTVYLAPTSTKGQQLIKGIIYADFKGKPGARLGVSEQLTFKSTDAPGWYDLVFSAPVKAEKGSYWIGIITGMKSKVAGERYDSVAKAEDYNSNSYTSGPSNPFGSFKTTNEEMSLYATYTAG